jgi:hypothetical protein
LTSATASSSTRRGTPPAGRQRPTEPISRRSRRRRSTKRSSRSSGGTRPTSRRLSGAARSCSRSSSSTYDAKLVALRRFLEWRIELDHDWALRPGAYGRGLERLLSTDIRSELADTYVGTDIEDNWDALFRTTALVRRVATEVGDALGYAYPLEVDEAVTARLEAVRRLKPSTARGTRGARR